MNRRFWQQMDHLENQMIKSSTTRLLDDTAKKDVKSEPVAKDNIIRVYHF